MPHQVEENRALLHFNLILFFFPHAISILLLSFRYNLHLNAIHAANQLGFENRLALLFTPLVAWSGTTTVDTSSDGYAVDFEGAIAIDRNEQAVQAGCQCNGYLGRDLDVRVCCRDGNGGTVGHFLLRGMYGDGPWFCEVEGRMCI